MGSSYEAAGHGNAPVSSNLTGSGNLFKGRTLRFILSARSSHKQATTPAAARVGGGFLQPIRLAMATSDATVAVAC